MFAIAELADGRPPLEESTANSLQQSDHAKER
jgi:hypothetical protein